MGLCSSYNVSLGSTQADHFLFYRMSCRNDIKHTIKGDLFGDRKAANIFDIDQDLFVTDGGQQRGLGVHTNVCHTFGKGKSFNIFKITEIVSLRRIESMDRELRHTAMPLSLTANKVSHSGTIRSWVAPLLHCEKFSL